jgi:putative PIN family toxin of toxin-antitoxin system
MRAVVDTNLLVSYLITHRPPIAELIDIYLARGDFVLLTCPVLLEELDRVLQYPRLHRYYDTETRIRFVALITALSETLDLPDEVPRICRDPNDDWIIACAVAGSAEVIVSGDRDLLDLGQVGNIPILSARQFLARLHGTQPASQRTNQPTN